MSNSNLTSAINNPITEDDIANYLANTPDFFERHAEMLAAVQLTSPHSQRAVSLQERQANMLREKIKMLELRIMDMIRNVNENMVLSDKLLQWARTLFLNTDPATLPDLMADELADQFAVPQVGIKVWGVDEAYASAPFAQGVSDDAMLFASSLTEPFCGVNTGLEAINWLPDPKAVASLAILPLRAGPIGSMAPAFGLLVLASPDAQRFNSTMGTDFLARVAELASAALSPLR
ncbi:DUF484 family protein [Rhodoferax sp.]|uniref:DUF484 family protein n=1 Tax=Rhodoferax sp. TaxID=50421 RepID=UPI0008D62945|nr:DUF484 family protein [Rhodoferax sp.]OGB41663.1 MAG: hypothetical protein A2461_06810 [Burkholderiales bacterium RIFOXYC2_FULL_59_8]OGB53959.1 MAG: hypothetical protein A2503_08665 [Burkholderiales bacterium RIFOXYD12_FULL_59_19]OGB82747.1 MAG: hypothetical protein A2496_20945 [Burkholderiales bacterium RIFOXYC12_FULL_60_6]MDO8321185.1 DUF484 family protein [Rhodoferax sp.]MDP2680550.1 DUF484 family protein [Rhodoferax sp.]